MSHRVKKKMKTREERTNEGAAHTLTLLFSDNCELLDLRAEFFRVFIGSDESDTTVHILTTKRNVLTFHGISARILISSALSHIRISWRSQQSNLIHDIFGYVLVTDS